jgi:hypothetical protein
MGARYGALWHCVVVVPDAGYVGTASLDGWVKVEDCGQSGFLRVAPFLVADAITESLV